MFFSSRFEYLVCSLLFLQIRTIAAQNAPRTPPGRFSDWTGWGANVYNNRWSSSRDINSTTLPELQEHCKFEYPLGVSAPPVVINSTIYYPTLNGSFYALNIGTCNYVWHVNVTEICEDEAPLTGFVLDNALPMSRTAPQIDLDRGILFFGTQAHAILVALNLTTGEMLGKIRVDDHPLAILTMSPTLYDSNLYIGVSSLESSATVDPTYPCCDFIGSFNSFSFNDTTNQFTRRWRHLTLPENSGWAGAGSWGSQPAVDPQRGQIFFSTGNIYIYPTEYVRCLNQTADCLPDNVWQESIVAIDIESGDINWKRAVSPLDAWVMVCGFAGAPVSVSPLCPDRPGPDTDFGMAPTFVPAAYGDGTTGQDSVIIGQKSGEMYSFNAVTGEQNWKILTAPQEGTVGGPGAMSWWGMASDDRTIFYTSINYGARDFTLLDQSTINNSAWGAASLKTGALLWQVPVPDLQLAYTPPSIAGDLMFVGRSGSRTVENDDTNGQVTGAVVTLSKSTGATLREFPISSIQRGGITIAGGFVIFGTGYHYQNRFLSGGLYVYGLPDAIELARLAPAVTVRRPTPATGLESASSRPSSSGTGDTAPAASSTRPNGSSRMVASVIYPVLGLVAVVAWFG